MRYKVLAMTEEEPNLNLGTNFIILGVLQNFIWISIELNQI
jgi:hypothetical protein